MKTERGFMNNEQGFSDTERGFIGIARFQQYRVRFRQHEQSEVSLVRSQDTAIPSAEDTAPIRSEQNAAPQ